MRFGCCGSMISPQTDEMGVEIVEQLKEIGYDYIELSLAHIMALSESDFLNLVNRVDGSGLKCEACNNFFPPRVRLTGAAVDWSRAEAYVTAALDRAAHLGVEVIVFGSAGAKNVPQGFPVAKAWQQIVGLLQMIDPLAGQRGITIAIEPLNKSESNIVNTAAEGLELAEQVSRENIKLLVDYYHLVLENESPAIVLRAGDHVRHVHFARVEGRTFPTEIEDGYVAFFENLKRVGYDGRVSVEAYTQDFHTDAVAALALLKQLA